MRRYLLLFLLITIVITAKAQNRGTVKAIVIDSASKKPMEFVTVALLRVRDTSLLSYTITDKTGAFTLRNIHDDEPSRLLISYVGYQSLHIDLKLKKDGVTDLGQLNLVSKSLKEVVITGERVPVVIKKDTIEFNAEAFKVRPNAVVEDLLRKLPGMQVDRDGHITVNGKDVSKIKVNGKDFFANDPTIATRNLDADMISKVQVYDDRENDPDHQIPDYEVQKIINLKFKKSFTKGTLDNLGGSIGTEDRYAVNVFLSKFQNNMQIGVKANSNNLSGTDLPVFYGFGDGGINKTNTETITFDRDFGSKFKLNINYEFRDNISDRNSALQRQQFIGDTTFNTNSINFAHQRTNDQELKIQTEWKPDTVTTIKFVPVLTYNYNNSQSTSNSVTSNTFVPLLNTSFTTDHSSGDGIQYQHNLSYYRKLNKKGVSLNITNAISVHPNNSLDFNNTSLISYVTSFPSDTLNRSAKNSSNDVNGNLNVGVHYPFNKKLSANVSVAGSHDRNSGDLLTYDQDLKTGLYNIYIQDQSSDLVRDQWQQNGSADLTYQFTDKISLKGGLTTELQQISNHFNSYTNDLNQNFVYLLPSAQLRLNKVTFSYGNDVRQPAINDLQPITIVYSPLFTFIGNPNLKPTRLHTWSVNYFDFRPQNQVYINLYSNIVIESNSIVRERFVSPEGAEVTTPINRNGRFTTNLNATASKTFKKQGEWQISTFTGLSGGVGHNFFEVNGQDGYQNTQYAVLTQNITANWNDKFEIEPKYVVNYAVTEYQLLNLADSRYVTQKAIIKMDLFIPQNYTWSVNYAYSHNPLVAPGFRQNSNLVNFSFSRRIQKKDRGEIKISCYDLLNQSVSSSHYASENTINDSQSQLLKRYFLLSYVYHFKNFR